MFLCMPFMIKKYNLDFIPGLTLPVFLLIFLASLSTAFSILTLFPGFTSFQEDAAAIKGSR